MAGLWLGGSGGGCTRTPTPPHRHTETTLRDEAARSGANTIKPAGGIFWLFPGIPDDLPAAQPFFESLGFSFGPTVYDVRADLTAFQIPETSAQLIAGKGMSVRLGAAANVDDLLPFILAEFGGNWWYNAKAFFDSGGSPADWLLLMRGEAIIGMSRLHHPGQAVIGAARYWLQAPNAGGLGPIGVTASLRGQCLGLAFLHETLAHLHRLGVTDAIADWTDLVDFYAKAGFSPWKRYVTPSSHHIDLVSQGRQRNDAKRINVSKPGTRFAHAQLRQSLPAARRPSAQPKRSRRHS